MRKIKILLFLNLVLLLFSCKNYKFLYVSTNKESSEKISKSFKYLKEDQLFLCFTKSYNNSKVKVFENGKKIFDSLLVTDSRNIAKAIKINLNSELTIYFEDIKKPLQITKEQMTNYKFIYIEKNRNKIIVEFNNGTKTLLNKSNYQPSTQDSLR